MSEPRSELRLRDLGREAQHAVDLPDLGSLERRGRALRFRRQAGVVAAALVVAATSVVLFQDRSDRTVEPAPDPRAGAVLWPGPEMLDLDAGTYQLVPSTDSTDPAVQLTVPEGWNAWRGPNRFNGHRPGDADNEAAVARSTWIAGVAPLHVEAVATEPCQRFVADANVAMGYDELVEAVRNIPGYRSSVDEDVRFAGYPATHLRLAPNADQAACAREAALFDADAFGRVGARGDLDVWVVDVRGSVMTVLVYQLGDVPQRYEDELAGVVDSVEFVAQD